MKKCIYTLQMEPQAIFNAGEHIFPRSIGGVGKLDKDWVSAEFNNIISKAEREFARLYPPIVLPRVMDGPMGRKEHHGKLGVGFLRTLDTHQLQLGYIAEGVPRTVWQLIAPIDILNQNSTSKIQCIVEKNGEEQQLIQELAKYKGKITVIQTKENDFGQRIALGWANKQVYAGVSSDTNKETAKQYAGNLLQMAQDGKLQPNQGTNIRERHRVEYQGQVSFRIAEIDRVYAKIAFNVLASLKGQNFVLRNEFNCIRNAIVTGKKITEKVSMPSVGPSQDITTLLHLSNDEHLVLLQQIQNELIGVVNLFGAKGSSVMVKLASSWGEAFDTTGYICDWHNKKEQTLNEYLAGNLFLSNFQQWQ